jgi:hypothetical protein
LRFLLYFRVFLNENKLKIKFKIFKNPKPIFSMIKKYLSDTLFVPIKKNKIEHAYLALRPSRSPTLGLFYFGPIMHGPKSINLRVFLMVFALFFYLIII